MLVKRFAFFLRPTGNIEISRGIRVWLATAVPMVIGEVIHQSELGLMVGLSAQILLFADVGGLYSTRAKTLILTVIGIALALIIGTLASSWLWLTIILVFIGLFLAGYLTVYGENGAAAGLVIGLVLLYSITFPPGGIELAVQRAFVVLIAGVWTLFLALLLWPFQPNQPLRQVVAKNFLSLAQYLHDLRVISAASSERLESSSSQVRQALLQSRETLTYIRIGKWGKSHLRELLIVLIEDSDHIMTNLIAVQELINLHPLPQLKTVGILLEDVFEQVASITEDIAQLILGKTRIPDCNRLQLLLEAIDQQYNLQKRVLESEVDNYISYAAMGQLKFWLKKLQRQLKLTTQTAQQLHNRLEWQANKTSRSPTEGDIWDAPQEFWWEPLQENFTIESPLFRHALRLGLGSALGVLIYTCAQIPHGFWIGLTLIVVLKPDFSLTFQRFFYRVIGTILGAGVVSLILAVIHNIFVLECIGLFSVAIGISLVRFHYSLSVFFITLFVLILSQTHPDAAGVNYIEARLICTLIGAALAFALSFGFARLKEELRFLSTVITAIEQVNVYFKSVMAVYLGENPYHANRLLKNRHKARLANITLQIALQRLINDPSTPFNKIESAITLTNYIPRLGRGVTILLTQLEQYSGSKPHPKVILFTQQVTEGLTELAQSLKENTPLLPLPPLNATVDEILLHLQQLQEERLTEISNHQEGTSTHYYLRDYNIVATGLQEIVRRLEAVHTAITRFKMAGLQPASDSILNPQEAGGRK